MSNRALGLGLLTAGGVIAVIGLIGMITSSGSGEVEAGATTTTAAQEPTTTALSRTTTSSTAPPATSTTAGETATTTLQITTTTTGVDERVVIEAFIVEFAAAIERGDVEFLFATLHPAVLAVYDEEVCRTFIQNEILLLEDYRLTGELTGPTSESIGGITFDGYVGPIAFTFQGEDFEAQATFALEEDGVKWFGECRG